MRAPAFWGLSRPSAVARLLAPAAAAYGAVARYRMGGSGARASVPVICVGNFTLGGAGKTPTAMRVAEILGGAGEAPVFLSRGYGGRLTGPVRVDPASHRAADVGDEPLLLARIAPTVVASDRVRGASLAVSERASVIVMDDGLQNPSLCKDFVLAVVDGEAGFGNGLVFPAGPLRAPLAAQWPHAAAVMVIGEGESGDDVARAAEQHRRPVFRARLEPDPVVAERVRGRSVLAFCGIGSPEKFFRTLERCGARVAARYAFADHHPFSLGEIEHLRREAEAAGLVAVTTEKDLVRLQADQAVAALARLVVALPVRLAIEDEAPLRELLAVALARSRPR